MMTTNKVAIYVRVSTTNQVEEGYSIDEQKDKLSSYCHIKDWSIYNIYTDGGFSGSNTERPALEQLIKDAKKKLFDTVLVYKLDRLSRSQKDTLYLIEEIFIKNGIEFLSLQENFDTSTPFGKAMIGLLAVFAQLEREQIKERMQLGKLGRAKSGKSMMWARTSYGYDYHKETGTVTINELEAIAVRDIFNSYLAGMSITKLRDKLNDKYPKTPNWHYRIIRGILANPVYCGYNQYKGQIFLGNHEPIISEKTFNKTQDELKARQIAAAQFSNNPRPFRAKYMLSGIAQCGYCGAPLQITLGTIRKDGSRNIRYQCKNRFPRTTKGVTIYNDNKKCDSRFYEKSDVEENVIQQISKLQNDPKVIDGLFADLETTIDRDACIKQIEVLSRKVSRLNDLYIDGLIALDELQTKNAEIINQRSLLEKELENDPAIKHQERKRDMRQTLSTDDIFTMDYEQQKVIVRALINKVQVTAESIKIKWKI
ncbi:recombinase family protein [Streptococcus anginosus]|uniref:recombinase family protein n=1 Tax=Streptococcus anginosus TaxID=1328 RepID=UPI001243AD6A|nr:recombinase family protein [Streptococcus anginosus]KAA9259737.1 recombinase family protein [Streptococcus anginosus]HEQ0291641.1 recombinase family protein [Streptococcus pyogenes]HES7273741.1 recombinase family protein [Streptococcus pyogenes]